MKFILGKKIEMSQKFQNDEILPVTLIKAGPCFVTQIKTKEPLKTPSEQSNKKDGYDAVQIGFIKKKPKKVKKTEKGKEFKYLREFYVSDRFSDSEIARRILDKDKKIATAEAQKEKETQKYKVGDEIKVDIFKPGEKVIVSGTSKGKGFAGVIKRHGFKGMPASHGTKHDARHAGSIGATGPQRVLKGKKMAGRMGGQRVTIKNLEIIEVIPEKNLLVVKGAVPGARNSLLEIRN